MNRVPRPSEQCVNHPERKGKYHVPGLAYCSACRMDYLIVKRDLDTAKQEWQRKRAFCIWGHTLDKANALFSYGNFWCRTCIIERRPGWTIRYTSDQVVSEAYPGSRWHDKRPKSTIPPWKPFKPSTPEEWATVEEEFKAMLADHDEDDDD